MKRSILDNSNAIYYYLHRENMAPATVARINGVTRQTINEKLKRELNNLSLGTFKQVAKAMEKPVDEVIKDIVAIDETLKVNRA